jgi:branched-chain amino acid transport system substrate-binding protein
MRVLNLITFALAVLILASCNPAEKKGDTKTDTTSSTDSTATSDAGPIKIGFCFEETGDAATFGISSHKGAEMAVNEINAAGGIDGRQIEAVFDDNASKSDQAATVASKLVNTDKVNVVIGAVASGNTLAMAKIVEDAGIPLISPASTRVDVTLNEDGSTRKYIFRTCFTDDFQGEAMVDFAVNGPLKAKNAVIFYASDNDYAVGIYETIKVVAPQKGLNLVAEDSFLATSETDFRTKLNRFKSMDFDVLIVPGYYKEAGLIANQAREVGLSQPLLGGDGFDSPDLWKNAGKNIEGSYFTNHYASDDQDPAVQAFITKYKELNGGNIPDAMAILAYDCVNVVADAIKRAGGTDPDALATQLAATKDFKAASGTITIDEKHNAKKKLVVLEIAAGGALKWVYSYDPSLTGGAHDPEAAATEGSADAGETADAAAEAAGAAEGGT